MAAGSLLDALRAAAAAGRGGPPAPALACVGRGVAEALAYLHGELRVREGVGGEKGSFRSDLCCANPAPRALSTLRPQRPAAEGSH